MRRSAVNGVQVWEVGTGASEAAVIGSLLVVAVVAAVARNACNARIAHNARNAAGPGVCNDCNDVNRWHWSFVNCHW